jgi:ketosteroid isomerase-like protein
MKKGGARENIREWYIFEDKSIKQGEKRQMKFKALWLILPLLAMVILPMVGCAGETVTTTVTAPPVTTTVTAPPVTPEVIAVINQFIEAEDLIFSTGDASGLLAVEDENIVLHMMNWPDTIGSANHVAAIQGIRSGAAGPITHEWSEITGWGDIGAVRWTETGTVGGETLTYQGAYFLRVSNGKIVEAWLISDMLSYFLKAGIVIYAPPPA